jgi:hypothetical protein
MKATKEDLLKLLLLSITELHILLNHCPPGKFREDAQKRIENLIAEIWSAQE